MVHIEVFGQLGRNYEFFHAAQKKVLWRIPEKSFPVCSGTFR